MSLRVRITACALFAGTPLAINAHAGDPLRFHIEAGSAHAITDPQAHEYGLGAEGKFALELPLGRAVGLQLEGGALWIPHKNRPTDPTLADHGDGTALSTMAGLRLRPFAPVAGPWADANVGYVRTGSANRIGFDAHIGYDWRVGRGRLDVGPYVGYFDVVQPPATLRPEDARIVSIGLHIALGAERPRPPDEAAVAPPPPPPLPPPPPPPPPPPTPPPDRDLDGIVDAEDACPDVPGVRTEDPKTSGCPAASDEVRVVKDRIEYDKVILFDTDQAHVHVGSWPILRKLAQFILQYPDIEQVDITGHADERGSEQHNLDLSQARAVAVKDRIVSFGVEAKRLTTIGYGKSKPRAIGHSENDWRQNRRVEFIITKVRNAQGGSTSLAPVQEEKPQ